MDFSKLSLGLVGVACAMALEVPVLQGGTAPSGPVAIGPGAFSGNETVIDFESIAQNEQITTQFAALGVTFSGDLFGDTFTADLFENTDPGLVVACNFIDNSCGPPVGCSGSWTVDFSSPVTRLGFDTITNSTDNTTLTIFRSNVQIGSITFDTMVPDSFVGVEDIDGIDRVIVDAVGNGNGAICVNNFRFEGGGSSLDIKPGSCPNSFNRNSHGVLPTALVGTETFDVTQVDLGSVLLSRADGVGGAVAPNEGPPGPHSTFEDVATPFDDELCDCHEQDGDGITDLAMKFKSQDVVSELQLDGLPPGDLVELCVSGLTLDGSEFEACDCVRLVPPGDMDGDGAVGAADFLFLLAAWGPCTPAQECLADLDDNSNVGLSDLLMLLANWG